MIAHIGLWRFRKDASQEKIDAIIKLLDKFPKKVPGVLEVKHGAYEHFNWKNSGMLVHEKHLKTSQQGDYSHGFNYGFYMLLKDRRAREAYDSDPLHVEIARMVIELLEGGLENGVVQFDFEF